MIKNKKRLVSLALSLALAIPNVVSAAGSSVDCFSDDFGSSLANWTLGGSNRNVSIAADPLNSSNKALKISLPKDRGTAARVMYYDCAPYSQTVKYNWKFMVDPSHSNNSSWETLGVFPSNSGSDTPTVGLDYHAGKVVAYIYDAKNGKYIDSEPVSVSKGEWTDVELEVNWSEKGYLKASIGGKDATGGEMYGPTAAGTSGNFLELGVVRDSSSRGTSLVYFDDVAIEGASSQEEIQTPSEPEDSTAPAEDIQTPSEPADDTASADDSQSSSDSDSSSTAVQESGTVFKVSKQYGDIENWALQSGNGTIGVVADPKDSSNRAVKFELNNGSYSRMTYDGEEAYGDTVVYKWKMMVDTSHSNTAEWETLGVFPAKSGSEAPPVGINYHDGKMLAFVYNSNTGKYTDSSEISITKGQWVDVEMEVKWSKEGYMRTWVNGKEITSGKIYGPTSVDSNVNNIEWGVVRESSATGESLVYFDDLDINVIDSSQTSSGSDSTTDSNTGTTDSNTGTTDSSTGTTDSNTGTTGSNTGTTDSGSSTTVQEPTAPAQPAQSTPNTFYDNFEAGNFNNWDELEDYNGQIGQIVKDPMDPTNDVFMAHTWQGYDKNIRPRAELRVNIGEQLDKEYWYSWKFMIDENYSHNSASEIIGQWHTQPDPSKGETWSNWVDGSFALALEIRPDGQLDFASTPMGIIMQRTGIYPEKGKWHTVTWRIKHSTSSNGYVEGWVDGVPMFKNGPIYGKTSYNNAGSYLKVGSYRYNYTSWTNPNTYATGDSVVYYDDIKVSTNKADVDF